MIRRLLTLLFISVPVWAGYAYKATVAFTGATGSTQPNITLLYTFSDIKLAYKTTPGGKIQNLCSRNGYSVPCDFAFSNDSTCATITGGYTWGFDGDYSATAGTGHGWVMVPSYTTSGVTPTLCFGDATVITYQGGAPGAEFDAFTLSRVHWGNGSTLNLVDFSASAFTYTNVNTATATTGQIGGGVNFSGSSQRVTTTGVSKTALGTSFTIKIWIKPTGAQSVIGILQSAAGNGPSDTPHILLQRQDSTHVQWYLVGGYRITLSVNDGSWYELVLTYNGTIWRSYINAVAGGTYTDVIGASSGTDFTIGDGYNGYWSGVADEFVASTTVRTPNWIATEYANQNAPPAMSASTAVASYVSNQSVISIQ